MSDCARQPPPRSSELQTIWSMPYDARRRAVSASRSVTTTRGVVEKHCRNIAISRRSFAPGLRTTTTSGSPLTPNENMSSHNRYSWLTFHGCNAALISARIATAAQYTTTVPARPGTCPFPDTDVPGTWSGDTETLLFGWPLGHRPKPVARNDPRIERLRA